MDAKKISEHGSDSSYQSYGEQVQAEQNERARKRDIMQLEYDIDRDTIQGAIKKALRERNYDEAQEFVFHYRAAAKSDETFERLAKLTADAMKNKAQVDKIQAVIDATEEDDYEVRLSLSERAYKLIPDESNLEQVNHYRELLGKPLIENPAFVKQSNEQSLYRAKKSPAGQIIAIIIIIAIGLAIFSVLM